MILCSAVAGGTLGIWAVDRAGRLVGTLPDRLSDSLTDVGASRVLATALLAATGLVAMPRSAGAEPIPPIVRLADEPLTDAGVHREATYEVRKGDSLWCIAAREIEARTGQRPSSAEIAVFWPRIYSANRAVIGDDPNLILPGQWLTIPPP